VGNLGTSKQSNDTFERKCDELVVKMALSFQFFIRGGCGRKNYPQTKEIPSIINTFL
jgi:hypothetical protein